MKSASLKDTICAISTPAGEAGIGIVRLSGKKALSIADKIFMPKNGEKPSEMAGYTVHYGHIVRPSSFVLRRAQKYTQQAAGSRQHEVIDEVLLTIMRSPKSYTKEDVVEINAHGGITCLRKILDLAVSCGARPAQPGEFTKRAFLNGRIDLSQAEAVLDIITAKTEAALRAAKRQLDGELSESIKEIRRTILEIQANVEASLDFPDEELKIEEESALKAGLNKSILQLKKLLIDYQNGRVLRQGVTTVICGKPNVGKSTLMNRFLKQKRVIVTPIPGTTRDAIEEIVNVKGIPLKIVDTAGIIQNVEISRRSSSGSRYFRMHADDEISKEGILRSKKYMESADLLLLVLDSNNELSREDIDIIDAVKEKKILVVVNKTDLPERLRVDEVKKHLHNKKIIRISAKKDKNLDRLYDAISNMVWSGNVTASNQPVLTNIRHAQAIKEALKLLESARGSLNTTSGELIALELKEAINKLGLITGENFTEDLLDEIFSRFCIGK